MEITFSKYVEQNNKSAIALLDGKFPFSFKQESLAHFLRDFFRENITKEKYWLAVYDREPDFVRSDGGYSVAMARKDGRTLHIDIRDRKDYEVPYTADLQIMDEWNRLIDLDVEKSDPNNLQDAIYESGDEYERKIMALACDKYGYSYEKGYPMFTRARDFLFLARPVSFQFSL